MTIFALRVAALALLAATPNVAWASGGAYIVDDYEISDPGTCRIETWGAAAENGDWLAVVAPACTFRALPMVEFGLEGHRTHTSGLPGYNLNAKAKAVLGESGRGAGFSLAANIAYDPDANRLDSLYFYAPLTLKPSAAVKLNLNLGWFRDQIAARDLIAWGAGLDWAARETLIVTGELFGHNEGPAGFQFGLRPTFLNDRLEIDIIAGRNITGTTANWLTFGATIIF